MQVAGAFFYGFFLLIIILSRKEFEMRKKYDNPALLTVNFAFDTRLLDLVANTYQKQPQPSRETHRKRSHSEKNTTHSTKIPFENNFIRTQSILKTRQVNNKMTQSLPKLTTSKQKFLISKNSSLSTPSQQFKPTQLKVVHINRHTLNDINIDQELTKNMIKTIRKNILSTNITPSQLNNLQNTYKQLKKKFNYPLQQ